MRVGGLVIVGLVSVVGCAPGPRGQALIYLQTDLPVPRVIDSVRIEVIDGDEFTTSRELALPDPTDWPVSFGVAFTGQSVLVRARAFLSTRLTTKTVDGGVSNEPEPGPDPIHTVDRVVLVNPPAEGIQYLQVVLTGDCLGVAPSFGDYTSCISGAERSGPDTDGLTVIDGPPPSLVGTWPGSMRQPCAGAPRTPSSPLDFDNEVCIGGGSFFLGDERLDPSQCSPACNAYPERFVRMSPYYLDKYNVTVGRWRKAMASGFNPPGHWSPASYCTYDESGVHDKLPMTCVDWTAASAFCKFDGGRHLTSEAELEFAASGDGEERAYPWFDPALTCDKTIYGRADLQFMSTLGAANECASDQPYSVLSLPIAVDELAATTQDISTDGVVGLGGNAKEWAQDLIQDYSMGCWKNNPLIDPVCTTDGALPGFHTVRGGSFAGGAIQVNVAWRDGRTDDAASASGIEVDELWRVVSFRCARSAAP